MDETVGTAVRHDPAAPVKLSGPAPTWDAMVNRHYAYVYRRCLVLARDPQDAEDLAQETFVSVFRSWATFRRPGNVEAWLNCIATNLFINLARRRNRVKTRPLFDTDKSLPTEPSAIDLVTDQILDTDVAEALAAMTPKFRTVVVLNDIAGVPRDQIADLLELKPATVSTRLYRGREQLRGSLAHRRRGAEQRRPGCGPL
jgi:RNA polymerase sigma-70 factor (ECF subfamily)